MSLLEHSLLSAASRYQTSLDPGLVWSVALLAALAYAVRSAGRSGARSAWHDLGLSPAQYSEDFGAGICSV